MTIEELATKCACGVYLHINEYRDAYLEIDEGLAEAEEFLGFPVDPDTAIRIRVTKTIVTLQFYPNTPIGFHFVVDSSVANVLKRAEDILHS